MKRKMSRALAKRIIEFAQEIEELHCQKYTSGKCSDFAGITSPYEHCAACQIRESAIVMKRGAEKYKPEQIVF